MSLEPHIAGLVLLAAVTHAVWNALAKGNRERLITMTLVQAVPVVLAAMLVPFVPVPAAAAWPYLIASVIIHNGYFFFLMRAYQDGDLSLVYPVARGIAPLLVAILAALVIGEVPPSGGIAGIALVSLGILSLAFADGVPRGARGTPVLLALLTGFFITAYTLCDGLGTRAAGTPLAYIVWLFFLAGIPFFLGALAVRGRSFIPALLAHGRWGAVGGALSMFAYALVLYAMSKSALAYVSALRETSVLFAALIGTISMHEPFGSRRIAAAVAIVAGLIVLELNG